MECVFKKTAPFLAFLVFFFSFLPSSSFFLTTNHRADDLDYITHAFTIALDFDLDYANEDVRLNKFEEGRAAVPVGPVGPGLMAAPFVAAFSVIDRIQGHPVIEKHSERIGSWSLFGFLFASSLYFLLGLMLYASAFQNLFSSSRASIYFLAASTGMLFYVLNRFSMTHSFEFFELALIVWGAVKAMRAPQSWSAFMACGCGVALTFVTRVGNYNVLLLPFLLLTFFRLGFMPGCSRMSLMKDFGKVIFCSLIAFIPVIWINYSLYGSPFQTLHSSGLKNFGSVPAEGLGLDGIFIEVIKSLVYLPTLLFSSEFGLFFSNPVVFLGIPTLLILIPTWLKKDRFLVSLLWFGVLFYTALPVAVVLLWKNTASSYGYRYVFSLIPLGLLGVLYLFKIWKPDLKKLKYVFCFLVIAGILSQMLFPVIGVKEQVNAFGRFHEASANGYGFDLVKATPDPKSWAEIVMKGSAGVLFLKAIQREGEKPQDFTARKGFGFLNSAQAFVERVLAAPFSVFWQIIILNLLWISFFVFYLFRSPRNELPTS